MPYLCLREKVLTLIAPIQFKSIGSFDPFSKGGGSDSQVGVDVLEIQATCRHNTPVICHFRVQISIDSTTAFPPQFYLLLQFLL